jgi:hypothetical protein
MTIRLPLVANMHGAQLTDSDAGFTVKAASGALLGVLPRPPVPWLFEHENPVSAPMSTWASQKMIETYVELDAETLKLKRDDTVSETERLRRLHLIRKKAETAIEHIESGFAKNEGELQASEQQHYAVPALESDDLIGAMRENEIRTVVRGMTDEERGGLMRSLDSGEDRTLLMAILRSPLKSGRLDVLAQNGWRAIRDREDPEGLSRLNLWKSYNDWGRRIVGAVQGAIAAQLRA